METVEGAVDPFEVLSFSLGLLERVTTLWELQHRDPHTTPQVPQWASLQQDNYNPSTCRPSELQHTGLAAYTCEMSRNDCLANACRHLPDGTTEASSLRWLSKNPCSGPCPAKTPTNSPRCPTAENDEGTLRGFDMVSAKEREKGGIPELLVS